MKDNEMKELLIQAVKEHDLDWIICQLVKGAVERHNEASEGDNKAEKAYWQAAVIALADFLTKCEDLV